MARPTKLLSTAVRSLSLRASRALPSLSTCLAVCVLVLLSERVLLMHRTHPCATAHDLDEFNTASKSYVFVFSTGRCGTQHLSRTLVSAKSPRAYVTHEEEHALERTRTIVERVYRRLASLQTEEVFNLSAARYVREVKLSYYDTLLHKHDAQRLVYTGHVPLSFGLGPSLIRATPRGTLRIVRLRRERVATARSLMALGPVNEDPWGDAPRASRRWFPVPTDALVRLHVSHAGWARLNRFQRWLWYVDDIECRWQALKREFAGRIRWMEVSLEGLAVMDGGEGWEKLANFMGVVLNKEAAARHNSIQSKGRFKDNFSEIVLRQWDEEYRNIVGACRLDSHTEYGWR